MDERSERDRLLDTEHAEIACDIWATFRENLFEYERSKKLVDLLDTLAAHGIEDVGGVGMEQFGAGWPEVKWALLHRRCAAMTFDARVNK